MITKGDYLLIKDLYARGMSISDIAKKLEIDRKTVRKYLNGESPVRKPRERSSKLDPFKNYILTRMREDEVLNSEVLLREIKKQGYQGGRTILKDFMQPFRVQKNSRQTIRYETVPGEQMQVDWKHVGEYIIAGERVQLSMFVAILGFSRMKYARFTISQDREHLLDCLTDAFEYFGGVTRKILFDNMRTIMDGREAGQVKWNETFLDFASYYGFFPRACKPYRAQTKGKVERAIQFIANNFFHSVTFISLDDLNRQLLRWLDSVGNRKINSTTNAAPQELWLKEDLQSILEMPRFDTSYKSYRKVHLDGTFSYKGETWRVPLSYVGAELLVKENLSGEVSLFYKGEKIQLNENVVYFPSKEKKRPKQRVPAIVSTSSYSVEVRPLSAYEDLLKGDLP